MSALLMLSAEPRPTHEDDNVVSLDEDTFDEFIKAHPLVLVMFYASYAALAP